MDLPSDSLEIPKQVTLSRTSFFSVLSFCTRSSICEETANCYDQPVLEAAGLQVSTLASAEGKVSEALAVMRKVLLWSCLEDCLFH